MSFGINLNKFKNALVLESKTSQGLLNMIQQIKCPVEVIQVYCEKGVHYAWIITDKKLIRKIKQE